MAEVLGAVASGLSIAELALKTVHAGFKFAELWRGVREFPADIQRRLRELEILAMQLRDLESGQASSPPSSALYMARVQCHTCLTDLQKVLDDIQSRIQQRKGIKRSATVASMMLKGDVLARVDGRLASSLETLHSLKSLIEEFGLLRQQVSDIIQLRKPELSKRTFDLMSWSDCGGSSSDSACDWTVHLSTQPSSTPTEYHTEHLASLGSEIFTGCLEIEAHYASTRRHYSNKTRKVFPNKNALDDDDEYPHSRLEVHFAAPSFMSFPGWQRLLRAPRTMYAKDESLDDALMDLAREGNLKELTILLDSNTISLDEYAYGPILVFWQTANFLLDRGARSSYESEIFCPAVNVYDIGRRDPLWKQSDDGQDTLELQRLIKREHRNNFLPLVWSDDEFYGSEFIMERMRAAISLSMGAMRTPENTCQMIRCALGEWQVDLDLGIADNYGNTLLSGLAQAAGFLEGTGYADEVHELIREVLKKSTSKEAELQLPARCPSIGLYYKTPFFGLIGESLRNEAVWGQKRASTQDSFRRCESAMLRWLEDLLECGLDLASYGREEQFFLAQDTSKREFGLSGGTSSFLVRLISLDSGARPQDWKLYWSEATDELAGDFWTILEADSDISVDKSMPIPGAWIDDDISSDLSDAD
ncbi:hypothetical protein CSOJ01_14206 [Colletotrichum sojae]|uniref:Fungal N-terminal domain-containing protein n=1 Tax=Colletotrichum sojae TaxID=2175907 RepID=A0A8H6IQE0_9PEZI|nr:hypothetical protein CSOJ01_14206 [Colletotrichum sojae]